MMKRHDLATELILQVVVSIATFMAELDGHPAQDMWTSMGAEPGSGPKWILDPNGSNGY